MFYIMFYNHLESFCMKNTKAILLENIKFTFILMSDHLDQTPYIRDEASISEARGLKFKDKGVE